MIFFTFFFFFFLINTVEKISFFHFYIITKDCYLHSLKGRGKIVQTEISEIKIVYYYYLTIPSTMYTHDIVKHVASHFIQAYLGDPNSILLFNNRPRKKIVVLR